MYYHVWFVTKYRKPVLQGKIEETIKNIFSECIARHSYNVLEFETNKDHAHMLVERDNKQDLASMVRVLKSVSAKEILTSIPHFSGGNTKRHFWAKRYGYKEINKDAIKYLREYIRNQKNVKHG